MSIKQITKCNEAKKSNYKFLGSIIYVKWSARANNINQL